MKFNDCHFTHPSDVLFFITNRQFIIKSLSFFISFLLYIIVHFSWNLWELNLSRRNRDNWMETIQESLRTFFIFFTQISAYSRVPFFLYLYFTILLNSNWTVVCCCCLRSCLFCYQRNENKIRNWGRKIFIRKHKMMNT